MKFFLSTTTFLFACLYTQISQASLEEVIYEDLSGNILSQRIRSSDEISYGGFEESCTVLINPTPCIQYGGGGFSNVYSCTNINPDQISVHYANQSEPELQYRSRVTYTCYGNFITMITLRERSCYALPGGGGNNGIRDQFDVTQYFCP